LFESYLKVVNHYKPKLFIFENVPGMLSAAPDGELIIDKIKRSFENYGYKLTDNLKSSIIDLTEFGIPQNRKRIIILGVNENYYKEKSSEIIEFFYEKMLLKFKTKKMTVKEAISDLPKLYPSPKTFKINGKNYSHIFGSSFLQNHLPRFHNDRDIGIFRLLAKDIESGDKKYIRTKELKELYSKVTGKKSNVHKYYVLRWNEQSNTIPAHLYKDGLRHIHPDPEQARSITVREAARLQTFDDDYVFSGSIMEQYKMIGNAVPPKFSYVLAQLLNEIINKYDRRDI